LPTVASEGRANLHQGAAAAAVDLVTGRTFGGVCRGRTITRHPDTCHEIAGLQIPGWHNLLAAAMKLADALEMGYIGVDFVIDAKIGAKAPAMPAPVASGPLAGMFSSPAR